MSTEALVVIDFQNDFTPGGALAVAHGDEIAGRVRALAESGRFGLVIATRDWHPADHGSFDTADPPGPWPPHCVQGTRGAELHDTAPRDLIDVVVDKGQDPAADGYSAFEAPPFEQALRDHGVERITFVGLATDYCVKNTALDALRSGFTAEVDREGVRGIDVEPGDVDRALDEIRQAGGTVV